MTQRALPSSTAIRTSSVRPTAFDRRAGFLDLLSNRLRARSLALVSAEFGRQANHPLWMLTLELPNQHVITVQAQLDDNVEDPFAPAVCEDVARRLIKHFAK